MENWLWGTRYQSGVETTDRVGENTQWDEGCVVVEGVGGANHEFAWVRGFVPKIRISSRCIAVDNFLPLEFPVQTNTDRSF